jgi:hypothetical protein
MSIFTKATAAAFIVCLTFCFIPNAGICAKPELKIVTRIETATAVMKGRKLVIRVEGMATTGGSFLQKGGQLVRRGENSQLNKEGLLEYELHFNPGNYTGDKLGEVKAALTERSVPADIKGARIFAKLNQMDALIVPPKEKKKKEKKK